MGNRGHLRVGGLLGIQDGKGGGVPLMNEYLGSKLVEDRNKTWESNPACEACCAR